MRKYLVPVLLVLIVSIALFLRVYKLDKIPPATYWDEVAVGYNAFSIANYGMDEWGKTFPVIFKSFGEYKNPVHIYITSFFVKLFGLSDFSTRIPSALFGVLNVVLIYFLVYQMFKSRSLGLISSFFLAISPYNIQFSRFNHELNFAIFFFILGLILFFRSLSSEKYLVFSVGSFVLSLLSYNAAKIFIPLFLVILFVTYFKAVKKMSTGIWLSMALIFCVFGIVFLNPNLLGLERFKQTSPGSSEFKSSDLYKKTGNVFLGKMDFVFKRYLIHFNYKYLFVSGDSNPRHSTQAVGEFYKIEGPFLIIGMLGLLFYILKKKSKEHFLLLSWVLLGPFPAAIASEAPHAARAMFTNGSWHIIAAFGVFMLISLAKKRILQIFLGIVIVILLGFEFKAYIRDYYSNYATRYAIEWQYGMKEIAEYIKKNGDMYHSIYMTNVRHQPYIFLLYHLGYPTTKFVRMSVHTEGESQGYNNVLSFDKYSFDWDTVNSFPEPGILYVLTPSEYGGLARKASFEVRKVIKYPNGGDAFFLVSATDINYE